MSKPAAEMTRAEKMEAFHRHEQFTEVVAEMFARGASMRAISTATGIPRTTVHSMCKRLSAEYVRERYGDLTSALGRELHILDLLTQKNLVRAQNGDKACADIVLNSHIRRSKLLGLDAAVKAELTVKSAQDIEIERLVRMMSEGVPDPAETDGSEML